MFTQALIVREPLGLVVVDLTSNKAETHAQHPYLAAWEPGGQRLAFINAGNPQIHLLTPTNKGWVTQTIQHGQFVEGLAWRPILSQIHP